MTQHEIALLAELEHRAQYHRNLAHHLLNDKAKTHTDRLTQYHQTLGRSEGYQAAADLMKESSCDTSTCMPSST